MLQGMNIKEAIKTPMFWLILATATLMVFGSSAILFNSAPFFIECGFSTQKAALVASFNLGMLAVGKIFIGFISDKLGTKFGSILSGAIFGLGFLSLALMPMNPNVTSYSEQSFATVLAAAVLRSARLFW